MATAVLAITGGKIIPTMEIPDSSTILQVKERIKTVTNVDVGRQTLKFNNQELMNDKTLADFDIKLSADLVLEVAPLPGDPEFNILVKFCTQDTNVNVKETTVVAQLRDKIARFWGIPRKNATLQLGSTVMNDDDAPVSAYYLCEGSQVEVKVIGP